MIPYVRLQWCQSMDGTVFIRFQILNIEREAVRETENGKEIQKEKKCKEKKKLPTTVSIYLIGIKSSHPQVWYASSTAHTNTYTEN